MVATAAATAINTTNRHFVDSQNFLEEDIPEGVGLGCIYIKFEMLFILVK